MEFLLQVIETVQPCVRSVVVWSRQLRPASRAGVNQGVTHDSSSRFCEWAWVRSGRGKSCTSTLVQGGSNKRSDPQFRWCKPSCQKRWEAVKRTREEPGGIRIFKAWALFLNDGHGFPRHQCFIKHVLNLACLPSQCYWIIHMLSQLVHYVIQQLWQVLWFIGSGIILDWEWMVFNGVGLELLLQLEASKGFVSLGAVPCVIDEFYHKLSLLVYPRLWVVCSVWVICANKSCIDCIAGVLLKSMPSRMCSDRGMTELPHSVFVSVLTAYLGESIWLETDIHVICDMVIPSKGYTVVVTTSCKGSSGLSKSLFSCSIMFWTWMRPEDMMFLLVNIHTMNNWPVELISELACCLHCWMMHLGHPALSHIEFCEIAQATCWVCDGSKSEPNLWGVWYSNPQNCSNVWPSWRDWSNMQWDKIEQLGR